MSRKRDGTHLSKILRALAAAPGGALLTTELVEPAGWGHYPPQRGQTMVGNIIRRACRDRLIEWAGQTTDTGWQRCPVFRWRITPQGRQLIEWWDAGPERLTRQQEYAAAGKARRAAKAQALAEAQQRYGPGLPRWERQPVSRDLRAQGLTLREIGGILGVTAQSVYLDVTSPVYPPYDGRGQWRKRAAMAG